MDNMEINQKRRLNVYISEKNYEQIDDIMSNHELISMKLSKGSILDLALSNLFYTLKSETLEEIAIKHLKGVEDNV